MADTRKVPASAKKLLDDTILGKIRKLLQGGTILGNAAKKKKRKK